MSSDAESSKIDDEDFSCGLLLRDIEEISKALYLHRNPQETSNASYDRCRDLVANTGISESKSNVVIQNLLNKDKKSSIWKWKPLKALIHIRNHRLDCCFFLHVHAIEGLPWRFNNLKLCVTWKRKADVLRTSPALVSLGMAEFDETLIHRCTVYVGRNGPHSPAKYEPKLFLLQASVIGAPTVDIGSRWIDLSRLLPLTLEELEVDKSRSGKWTTSFNLTGKAEGAMLNVSFGFSILNENSSEPGRFVKVPGILKENGLSHFADSDMSNVRGMSSAGSYQHSQSTNSNFIKEIFPKQGSELSQLVALPYQKFDWAKMGDATEFNLHHESKPQSDPIYESSGGKTGLDFDDTELDVIGHSIEVSMEDQIKREKSTSQRYDDFVTETIDVAEIFAGEEAACCEYGDWNSKLDTDNHDEPECATDDLEHRDDGMCSIEPTFEELESEFYDLLTSKKAEMFTLSLDDVAIAESIENDFLAMLGNDQSQDGIASCSDDDPPTDLLRLFEEDPTLAHGNPILGSDVLEEQKGSCRYSPTGYRKVAFSDDIDLSFAIQAVERNPSSVNQALRNKRNAEVLENLETEALMLKWGLTENAFQYSPRVSSGGFGSPVYVPAEEPLRLPSLEEGLGPIIRTKDGGFLRSMNPMLFRNTNNGARLIMQISAPVVLPSAMGLVIMEMLQCWASVGLEKMFSQANDLMHLDDVTGKTVRQVFGEVESGLDASNRSGMQQESDVDDEALDETKPVEHLQFICSSDTLQPCSIYEDMDSDYVSLKDLVPMAITNIECLLVEGLKIQSGMPDQEPPSSIKIHLSENAALLRKAAEHSSNLSSETASGLQVQDVDELIKHSLSLEEWLKLDSGELRVEDDNLENILKLLAAHCAKPAKTGPARLSSEDEMVKLLDRRIGIFPNKFIMCLKVQLRNPLRNHEMVGSSMLALVQVDRVYRSSSEETCDRQEEVQNEHTIQERVDFEQKKTETFEPMFKVSEAHLAGPNVVQGSKPFWAGSRQQQSGSRWLLSSGIAKPKKNLISNFSAVLKSSGLSRKALPENVLWSITIPCQGEACTWNDQIALNVHVRNPDIIFPTESK